MARKKKCVDPDAPIVSCWVCGAKIHTCERKKAINSDYRCPVHGDGCELSDGRWVCSDKCWDIIVDGTEEGSFLKLILDQKEYHIMGSIIKLEMQDQEPFRRGLKLLKNILNNHIKFEVLVAKGVKEIFIISGLWNAPRFKKAFGAFKEYDFFNGYGIDQRRFKFSDKTDDAADPEAVRIELDLIRRTLNNKYSFNKLAEIGPVTLTLSYRSDFNNLGPGVLVGNHIPGILPNADWSIDQTCKVYFHS